MDILKKVIVISIICTTCTCCTYYAFGEERIYLDSNIPKQNSFNAEVPEERNEPWIAIKAEVPEGFNQSISINFYGDSGINAAFTLTNENGYIENSPILKSNYKLDYISIYGDIRNEYEVIADDTLNIIDEISFYEFKVIRNEVNVDDKEQKTKQNVEESKTYKDSLKLPFKKEIGIWIIAIAFIWFTIKKIY